MGMGERNTADVIWVSHPEAQRPTPVVVGIPSKRGLGRVPISISPFFQEPSALFYLNCLHKKPFSSYLESITFDFCICAPMIKESSTRPYCCRNRRERRALNEELAIGASVIISPPRHTVVHRCSLLLLPTVDTCTASLLYISSVLITNTCAVHLFDSSQRCLAFWGDIDQLIRRHGNIRSLSES